MKRKEIILHALVLMRAGHILDFWKSREEIRKNPAADSIRQTYKTLIAEIDEAITYVKRTKWE